MKRLFTLILTFIICATFFIIPTSAETYDTYDSRYLTSEEKAQLAISYDDIIVTSDDTVIKLYWGLFSKDFIQQKNITSIINISNVTYMVAKSSEEIYIKDIYQGVGITREFDEWDGFYTYTIYPNLIFDSSVKVNKIYCLDGSRAYDGVYIYYDTDHGAYVLFKKYANAKETYLFPLSDFYEYTKAKEGVDGANMKFVNEENYLLSDTPHAVPHQDTNNDEKCDACGSTIPENNDPFPHISKTNTDKPTDKTEETEPSIDKFSKGCSSSVAFSAVVIVGIMSGTALIVKKKED